MPIRKELRHLYRTPEYKAARAACRERAGDRCEECGKLNGQIEWRFARSMKEIHRSVVIQCGASQNNVAGDDRPENLRWLCCGCHLAADRAHHKATRSIRKDAARPLLAAQEWGTMFEKLAAGGTCAPRPKKEKHDGDARVRSV
jgi:hypothetical protein